MSVTISLIISSKMASPKSSPSSLLSGLKSFHSCDEAMKSKFSRWFMFVSFPDCLSHALIFWQMSCSSSSGPRNSPILCSLLSFLPWPSTTSLTQSNRSFFLCSKTLLDLKHREEEFDQTSSCNSVTPLYLGFSVGDWTNTSRREADDTESCITLLEKPDFLVDEFSCFLVFALDSPENNG